MGCGAKCDFSWQRDFRRQRTHSIEHTAKCVLESVLDVGLRVSGTCRCNRHWYLSTSYATGLSERLQQARLSLRAWRRRWRRARPNSRGLLLGSGESELPTAAMAALFQQLAAGAPSAPLDDEPAARILTDPSQRDRVLEDHYNLLQVCPCCAAAPAPPTRVTHTQTPEL